MERKYIHCWEMAQCTPLGQKEKHWKRKTLRIVEERTIIWGLQKKMLLWPAWSYTDMLKSHEYFGFYFHLGFPEWQPNTLALHQKTGLMYSMALSFSSKPEWSRKRHHNWIHMKEAALFNSLLVINLLLPPLFLAVLMFSVESLDFAFYPDPWDVLQGWKEKSTT